MTFSAQDIALILTTLTTAATAFAGLILPLWNSKAALKREQNREIQKQFREHFDVLISEANRRAINHRDQAFLAQRNRIPGVQIEIREFSDDFEVASLRFESLGKSYGIDSERLAQLVGAQSITHYPYWNAIVSPEKVEIPPILAESTDRAAALREQVLNEVGGLWTAIRSAYPVN